VLNALPSALRSARAFAALLVFMAFSPSLSRADTLTWTGAGDGVLFSDPANWSPQAAPGTAHDCIIPAGSGTINGTGVFNIRSLETSRPINLPSCSTITLAAGLTLHDAAKITIQGNCTGLVLSGGTQQIAGDGEIVVITNTQASPILFSNGVNATIAPGVTIS